MVWKGAISRIPTQAIASAGNVDRWGCSDSCQSDAKRPPVPIHRQTRRMDVRMRLPGPRYPYVLTGLSTIPKSYPHCDTGYPQVTRFPCLLVTALSSPLSKYPCHLEGIAWELVEWLLGDGWVSRHTGSRAVERGP